MKKPIIGITPDFETKDNRDRYYLNNAYSKAIMQAGGIPLILTQQAQAEDYRDAVSLIDGLLLTGGNDHNPSIYQDEKHEKTQVMHEIRQDYELNYFREALQKKIPVLGICLGCQTINVGMGGRLIQDIPSQVESTIIHSQKETRNTLTHKVFIDKPSRLYQILGKDEIQTNSFHHQAVRQPGKGLVISAKAEDGVIESVEADDNRFILGIQWHPEELQEHEGHSLLFKAFVSEAVK